MIELENLDNRSVEEILDEAKKQILYLTDKWTNFQESDPGITLVELFAWLKSVQHEYLNRESIGVRRKFLSLLDVDPEPNRGSETLLEVSDTSGNCIIPLETKFKGGDMIFENLYEQTILQSKILSVNFKSPENDSEEEYYKFDGSRKFFLFGKDIDREKHKGCEKSFTINFDKPFPKDTEINLYFDVYTSKNLCRNVVSKYDEFEEVAEVLWEYYGEENGELAWHKLKIIRDDTYNFLFKGIIRFSLRGEVTPVHGLYKFRAKLLRDEYDYPPRITAILTNVFKVVQNETKCENTIIKKKNLKGATIELCSHIALYGENKIFFKKHGGWVQVEVKSVNSDVKRGKTKIAVSDAKNLIKNFEPDDEVFMVVSHGESMKKNIILGSGTGTSLQEAVFEYNNILDGSLEIMVAEEVDGEEVFYKWKQVEDFYSSSKFDKHFVYDKSSNKIFFGDHIFGMAPRKIKDGIRLCGLKFSRTGDSNTIKGLVNSAETQNKILKNARITQIAPATGGRDEETLEHASARAAELFAQPGRAVTKSDYEEIVRKTPGLMFTNVKILPNYMKGEDVSKQNCVTVAVRWNRKIGLTLPKSYEKNIMNQINKYRLINTKVRVVAPEYVGLLITGDVVVAPSYRKDERLIEKEILNFIINLNSDLGKTLLYGDLFGMIDRLEYVSRLEKLRILPIDEHGEKNVSEDIVIPPNGVYYIQKMDFNYVCG